MEKNLFQQMKDSFALLRGECRVRNNGRIGKRRQRLVSNRMPLFRQVNEETAAFLRSWLTVHQTSRNEPINLFGDRSRSNEQRTKEFGRTKRIGRPGTPQSKKNAHFSTADAESRAAMLFMHRVRPGHLQDLPDRVDPPA